MVAYRAGGLGDGGAFDSETPLLIDLFDAQGQKLRTVETGMKILFSYKSYTVTVQLFPKGDSTEVYAPACGLSGSVSLEP